MRKRAEMETAGQQRQRRPPQLSDSCLITSATAPLTDLGVFGDSPCGGKETERDRDPPGNATRTRLLSSAMVVSVPAVVVALAKPNSSFPCFVWWRRPSFHVASDRAWPGVLRARVATACPPNCDASRSRWPPHQRLKWPFWCLCSPHQRLKWPLWCPCSPHQRPKWPLGCPLPIEQRPLPFLFGRTKSSRGRCHWPLAQKFISGTGIQK